MSISRTTIGRTETEHQDNRRVPWHRCLTVKVPAGDISADERKDEIYEYYGKYGSNAGGQRIRPERKY